MNRGAELEADLQSQASLPAQNESEGSEQEGVDRGEQPTEVSANEGQNEGERPGKNADAYVYIERESKERSAGEQSSDRQGSRGEKVGEQPAQSTADDEHHKGESVMTDIEEKRQGSSHEGGGEQAVEAVSNDLATDQASQWLKAILPEMTGGWWDVYPKGRGLAVKFCWRDPERQTLTFPQISYEQLQTLKQNGYEDAKSLVREKISLRLHSLSLDPARRDKALIAARKLGIDLD